MASIGKLNLMLSVATAPFAAGISKARGLLDNFRIYVAKSSSGMSTLGISASGTSGLVLGLTSSIYGLAKASIKGAADAEREAIGLTALAGSAEAAAAAIERLDALEQSTPFAGDRLKAATQKMLAFGYSAEEATGLIANLGNLAAASTGNMDDSLAGIVDTIGKMRQSMEVGTKDLKALVLQGIPAWEALASTLDTDVAEAQRRVAAGAVSVGTVLRSLQELAASSRFAELMDQQANSLLGLRTRLGNVLNSTLEDLGGILIEGFDLKGGVRSLIDQLGQVRANLEAWKPTLLAIGQYFAGWKDVGVFALTKLLSLTQRLAPEHDNLATIMARARTSAIDLAEAGTKMGVRFVHWIARIGLAFDEQVTLRVLEAMQNLDRLMNHRGFSFLFPGAERANAADEQQRIRVYEDIANRVTRERVTANRDLNAQLAAVGREFAGLRSGSLGTLLGAGVEALVGDQRASLRLAGRQLGLNFVADLAQGFGLGGGKAADVFVAAFKDKAVTGLVDVDLPSLIPDDIAKQLESPLDRAQGTLHRLNALVADGALEWHQYLRLVNNVADDLDKALGRQEFRTGGSFFGSREAEQAILAFQKQEPAQDPLQRVEDLQRQLLEVEKQQRRILERMAAPDRVLAVAVKPLN